MSQRVGGSQARDVGFAGSVEQVAGWRPAGRQPGGLCASGVFPQVREDLLDGHRILDAMILTAPRQA